jgi:hypothetical protein
MDDSPASGLEVPAAQRAAENAPDDIGQQPARLPPAERATELFLQNFQRRIEASSADNQNQIDSLRTRETVVFYCFIGTGALSLIILVAGFVLMATNNMTFGAISEIVGLVPGAASAGFKKAERSTRERSKELADRELKDADVLNAIGVTLMIPDSGDRSTAMVDLASRLAEMIGPRTVVTKSPVRATTRAQSHTIVES